MQQLKELLHNEKKLQQEKKPVKLECDQPQQQGLLHKISYIWAPTQ